MKDLRLILILSLALIGCQTNYPDFQSPKSPSTLETKTSISSPVSSQKLSPIPEHLLISDQGIGFAKLGMNLRQLKQKLGSSAQFKVVSPFMVDFDAIAVSQSGQIQYYVIYPSGTTFTDDSVIELLLTDNLNYRTAEGVGVGTTLREAQAIYGKVILSYNTQAESREMVRFTNYSSPNIIFLPQRNTDDFVGIYPPSSDEYHETIAFDDSAIIESIFVGR
ncbi:conserved hypothetical protein [Microcystis aeruginosa PCC 9809]|jgi:hypothetical protein|uniref:Lipoprotein n=1 Tax=Microcystis aeruginosa PCC 9809 TaxID=1160285 RepID=I4HVD4_MICAE|nr:hypothetical protein [Microcystis aeruginosa]CCI26008.1 conserved hypothetical protein [Microcystis aeruginosa PCC 9809]